MDRVPTAIRREICIEFDFSETSYYKYLEKFRERPVPSSLLPTKPGPNSGETRIPIENEKLLQELIKSEYLNRQNLTIKAAYRRIVAKFEEEGLECVSYETLWRRIEKLNKSHVMIARRGQREANSKNAPATAHFIAEEPMEVVEFDHTLADIILVDTINGEELG